jgi:nucleotide-binding universal stress UspA family protein
MYTHLLVPSDGSDLAQRGVDYGLKLAKEQGAKVTVVTVTEPFGGQFAYASDLWMPGEAEIKAYEEAQGALAERILSPILEQAKAMGVSAESVHVPGRLVSNGIMAVAEERGCDAIVMSSHGRTGLGRALLGSATSAVLAGAKIPVIVAK